MKTLYNFYIIHQRKYRENSLLVHIFTREFGKISAVMNASKKKINLYQPLVKLKGDIRLAKNHDGLAKIYNIELMESFYQKSYINLLSLQYINELIYLLLSYSHEEAVLFDKYDFILKNINDTNYKYLLRMFELELLNSLGRGIYPNVDIDGELIQDETFYTILPEGFKKSFGLDKNIILGRSIKKINQPINFWTSEDLKAISRVTKVCIDSVLAGRQLESRKLLINFLNIKK
ncbi:MAG: DNA repair protein RecO [Francisella sp.]